MSYLLGAGPWPTIRLPSRPGNLQLCPKDDGPAILTKKGNKTNVRGTTQRGVRNTTRVCPLRVQHLDQRQHLETDRLDVLQAGHPHKQRHRGLAPWPKSRSVWTNTTSAVPSDPASSQGSKADSNSDPLVSEKKLRRIQRRKYRELQQRIFELWDLYEAGERSARRLLKACSYLNGPVQI